MQATATTLDSGTENVPVNSRNKVVVASLIGTAIEFFDFYIYATAAMRASASLLIYNAIPGSSLTKHPVYFRLYSTKDPVYFTGRFAPYPTI